MAHINRITNWKKIETVLPSIKDLNIAAGTETRNKNTYSYELSIFAFERAWNVYLTMTEKDIYVTIASPMHGHLFADTVDAKLLTEPRIFIFFILNKIAAWIHENQ